MATLLNLLVVDRYQHAAVCVPTLHAMYVFGGLGTSGAVAEMWKYNLDSSRWSKLQVGQLLLSLLLLKISAL